MASGEPVDRRAPRPASCRAGGRRGPRQEALPRVGQAIASGSKQGQRGRRHRGLPALVGCLRAAEADFGRAAADAAAIARLLQRHAVERRGEKAGRLGPTPRAAPPVQQPPRAAPSKSGGRRRAAAAEAREARRARRPGEKPDIPTRSRPTRKKLRKRGRGQSRDEADRLRKAKKVLHEKKREERREAKVRITKGGSRGFAVKLRSATPSSRRRSRRRRPRGRETSAKEASARVRAQKVHRDAATALRRRADAEFVEKLRAKTEASETGGHTEAQGRTERVALRCGAARRLAKAKR